MHRNSVLHQLKYDDLAYHRILPLRLTQFPTRWTPTPQSFTQNHLCLIKFLVVVAYQLANTFLGFCNWDPHQSIQPTQFNLIQTIWLITQSTPTPLQTVSHSAPKCSSCSLLISYPKVVPTNKTKSTLKKVWDSCYAHGISNMHSHNDHNQPKEICFQTWISN